MGGRKRAESAQESHRIAVVTNIDAEALRNGFFWRRSARKVWREKPRPQSLQRKRGTAWLRRTRRGRKIVSDACSEPL